MIGGGDLLADEEQQRRVPGRPATEAKPYGANYTRFNIQITPGQRRVLAERALRDGVSVAELVREAIDDWLKAHGYDGSDPKGDGGPE